MRPSPSCARAFTTFVGLVVVLGVVVSAAPSWAEDEPATATVPTVYRDSWKISVNGKPQTAGTFTVVFTPLNTEPVKFTVNVVEKMKPKNITEDIWKELSIAAGSNYKVKQKGDKVVVIKKANKKVPGMALEITDQKLSGMSLTISAN